MSSYKRRVELEREAMLLGYEPERDETDVDLILIIRQRGGQEEASPKSRPHDLPRAFAAGSRSRR